ncbi:hypothetical protein [Kribbella koreensis]
MDVAAVPRRAAPQLAERTAGRVTSPPEELDESSEDDLGRPLLLGYIRRELIATAGDVQKIERQMSSFAEAEGFSMGFVFVDEPAIWPAVFEVMTDAVRRHNITAVVLPSPLHFAVLGASNDIKGTFERATGARVLLLNSRS